MRISEQGLALIRRFEGFSALPYSCPAGKQTIGFGHVIGAGETFPSGISEDQANALLKKDVVLAEQAICRLVEKLLTQAEFDALVSFVYNVGIQAFENSTLLRKINASDHASAAREFSRWVYARGVKLEGLIARRAQESLLFSGRLPEKPL